MDRFLTFMKTAPEVLKLVLVGAVLVLVTSFWAGREAKTELEDYIREYEAFQVQTQQTVKMLDSVRAVVKVQDVAIAAHLDTANRYRRENVRLLAKLPNPAVLDSLHDNIDSLKAIIKDSVEMARVIIPAQDTLIRKQDSTIVVWRASHTLLTLENHELLTANGLLLSQNGTLTLALDSARTNLINIPKPPEDPDKFFFGLLNKPTRLQTLGIGFVGGGITAIVVVNRE